MLTQEQIDAFERDGFTVCPGFLKGETVQGLLDEAAEVIAGNTRAHHDGERMEMEPDQAAEGTKVRRLYEPCTHYLIFRDYVESQKMLECVESLLGPNIICHYSKLNMKPPRIGAVVEWHQDLSYYPLTNRDSVAVLLYLDDTTQENGCLKIPPKMHEGSLMDHTDDGFF